MGEKELLDLEYVAKKKLVGTLSMFAGEYTFGTIERAAKHIMEWHITYSQQQVTEAERRCWEEAASIAEGFCTSTKEPCDAVESCQPEAIAEAIRRRSRAQEPG